MLEIKPISMIYRVLKPRKIKKDDHHANQQIPKRPAPETQDIVEHTEHIDEKI